MLLVHSVSFIRQESFCVSSHTLSCTLERCCRLGINRFKPEAEINFLPEQKFSQLGSTLLLEQSARWTTQAIVIIIIMIVGLVIITPQQFSPMKVLDA